MAGARIVLVVLVVAGCAVQPAAEPEAEPASPEVVMAEESKETDGPEELGADRETSAGSSEPRKFSRRLSPQAKKAAMLGAEGETVSALVQLSAAADPEALRGVLEEQGAEPGSWMEETRLLTVEIATDRLEWLAELPGVVYVEIATAYRE